MTKIDRFKLKKIRITPNEKKIILFLCSLIIGIYLCFPLITNDTPAVLEPPIKQSLVFKGEKQNEIILGGKYLNALYLCDGKIVSHFVDLDSNKEIAIQDILKKDSYEKFLNKQKELLEFKYPRKMTDILIKKAPKLYSFQDDYLYVSYDVKDLIETKRSFDLKIYYKEINDYLNFDVEKLTNILPESGYDYDPEKVSIAFSFDDGPNGEKTLELLSALEDYKMSASFFMVGYKLLGDQETVKKVYNSHSEIGYHSYAHAYFTSQSAETIKGEYNVANEILKDITGGAFKLTRPPYGSYNNLTLNSIDNSFIRWSLDTNDWRYKDPEYLVNYVLENYVDGDIILFHDTYDTSIEAAIELLERLYLLDVQVMSVSQLANLKGVSLKNNNVYFNFR